MTKNNDTIEIIEKGLKNQVDREKYLTLIISRMDESKRILIKTLVVLVTLTITFLLLAYADLEDVDIFSFENIDKRLVFFWLPSLFSASYYYYILTWMHYIQQRKIYSHLTSIIFEIDVESHLNDHIQPFNILDIISKHHESENKTTWGCITSLILLPIFIIVVCFPIAFVCFVLWKNQEELGLETWQYAVSCIVPVISVVLVILICVQIFRINFLGKE